MLVTTAGRIAFCAVVSLLCVAICDAFVVRRDCGAEGDCVHDDTTAFIAALTTGKTTTRRGGP